MCRARAMNQNDPTSSGPARMQRRTADSERPDTRRSPRRARDLTVRRGAAFAVAAAITLVLALNDGGYDIVFRQELALALWTAIALGLVTGVLPRGRIQPLAGLALGGFLALALLSAVALGWTESDERTFHEVSRVAGYASYLALPYFALSRYTARAAAQGVIAAALLIPVLAVIARLAPDLISDDVVSALDTDRLSYPLGYWNALSCWAAMAIASGLVLSAHEGRAAVRAALMAALPFAALTAYLTDSRAGVIALGVALVAALALSSNRWTVAAHTAVLVPASLLVIAVARQHPEIEEATGTAGAGAVLAILLAAAGGCAAAAVLSGRLDRVRMPRRRARNAVAVAGLIGLVAVAVASQGPLDEAWDEFRNEDAAPRSSDTGSRLTSFGGSRYDAWDTALEAFDSDPARGIGPGAFEFYWSREANQVEFVRDAHSLYAEQLAELGLPGLAFLLVALGAAGAAAVSARRHLTRSVDRGAASALLAAFAVFVVYAGVDWIWEVPALVFFGLGGVAVAGAAGFDRWGSRRLHPGLRIAAIAAGLGLALLQVPGIASTDRLRASAAELRTGDAETALELADDAVAAESFAASPYVQRALVREQLGDLEGARRDLATAAAKEPTNWRHPLLSARVAARKGDRDEMRRQLKRGRQLNPRSLFLVPGSQYLAQLQQLVAQAGS
jgi:tetratricopeptide (TPR) repeat protein